MNRIQHHLACSPKSTKALWRTACLLVGWIGWAGSITAQNPGGIAGAELWFRADLLAAATSSDVAWTDQTAPAVTSSFFNDIDVAVVHNFNMALTTGHNNDSIIFSRPAANITNMTAFVVFATTGANATATLPPHWRGEHAILSADQNGGYDDFGLTMGNGKLHFYSDATGTATRVAESAKTYNNGYATIGCFTRTNVNPFTVNLFGNGTLDGTGSSNIDDLNQKAFWGMTRHPGSGSGVGRMDGNFMEVVWFPSVLTTIQREAIETYLAIKYGITIGHDYTDATGAVKYSRAGYANEIIGIARVDATALNQRQSKTASTTINNTNLALYHGSGFAGTFPADNASNASAFAADNQYLITGHDSLPATFTGTYMGAANTILARTYKITDNGGIGTVTLRFDNTTFTGLATGRKYFLGVSNDATFDNSDSWTELTELGTSSDYYVEYNFSDNTSQFFTLREGGNFGPGGVSAPLEGWWRADIGTNGASVNTWDDQSPFLKTITRSAGAVSRIDGGVNFNPYLDLSNMEQEFGTSSVLTARTLVVVARNTVTTPANNDGLAGMTGSPGFRFNTSNQIKEGAGGSDWGDGGSGTLRENGVLIADGGTSNALSNWKVLTGIRTSDAVDEFWVGGFNSTSANPNPAGLDFAEAIVIRNSSFTGTTRQQIESYLAIKYGITLTPATYYSSTGGTVYSDVTYLNNVAGIARDDRSALMQKQSSSINADSAITVGIGGVIAATNALNTGTFPSDLSYFVFGDNAADDCWSNTEINIAGFTREYWRTIREWKYTVTGNVPSVVIRVDSVAGAFTLPSLPTGATNYDLLLDADGNFSAGATAFPMTRVVGTAAYEVNLTSADFGAGGYFTIAVHVPSDFVLDAVCNVDTVRFYGSNLQAATNCISLVGPSTFNLQPGAVINNSTYVMVQDNPGSCLDQAKWANLTIPSGTYTVNTFTGGCAGAPADLVTQTSITVAAAVAAGALEVNGSTTAFLCLGDPNAVLSGFGGQLNSLTISGSGNFSTLVDTTNFAATGFATLFVHNGNVGFHKVFLGTAGCSVADSVDVYIGVPTPSTFTYSSLTVCGEDPAPVLATTGPTVVPGTFSSTPVGLRVNPATGSVRADSSLPGTYFVTFNPSDSTCRTNSVAAISVLAPDSSVMAYPTTYCLNDTNPLPVITAPFPGVFSVSGAAGVGINSVTGEVLLGPSSVADTITVVFGPSTACHDSTYSSIVLLDPPAVSFTIQDSACDILSSVNADSLSPVGFAGQYTWGSPVPGAIMFSAPGRVNLLTSLPGGPHPISATYTDPLTGCSNTAIREITILDIQPLSLSYGALAFCQNEADPLPVLTVGASGGHFTSTAGLVFLDSLSGTLDLSASVPDTYAIEYVPPYAACNSQQVPVTTIEIRRAPDATFDMPAFVCRSDSSVTLNIVENGLFAYRIFTGNPNGNTNLVGIADSLFDVTGTIMGFTGVNNASMISNQTFLLERVLVDGFCSDTAYDYFFLSPIVDAEFDYLDTLYCQSESDPVPFIHGAGGGIFTALNGAVLDSLTGQFDLQATSPGTYFVQYNTPAPCPSSWNDTLTVKEGYQSYFRYKLSEICTSKDTLPIDTSFTPPGSPENYFWISGLPQVQVDPATGTLLGMASMNFNGSVVYTIGHATGDASSCPDTTKQEIILTAPDATFNIEYGAPGVDTFCARGTVIPVITGSSGFGRTLTNPPGLSYVNQGNEGEIDLQYSSPNLAYTVLMTNQSQCRDTALNRFYIRALEDPRFSYGSTEACSGEGTLLPDTIYTTPGVFSYVPSFSGAILSLDPTTGAIDMSASTKNTSYVISYRTLGACKDTASIQLEINASPEITGISSSLTFSYCEGDIPEVTCVGQGDVRWYLEGVLVGASRSVDLDNTADGDTLRAILIEPGSGCSDTAEVVLQVLPPPVAGLAGNDSILEAVGDFTLEIQAFQPSTVVTWSLEGLNLNLGLLGGNTDTLSLGDIGPLENTMSVVDSLDPAYLIVTLVPRTFGCTGPEVVYTLTIVGSGLPIFVPEVITPNGDLKNDSWKILYSSTIDPTNYTIEVYNRAGAKVYVQDGLDTNWPADGMPDGVYWWIIRNKLGEEGLQGGLTIRRR